MTWPAFLATAAGQIAFVFYLRRHGPPSLFWRVAVLIAVGSTLAAVGMVSDRTSAEFAARHGLRHVDIWERLSNTIRWSTGPTLWVFALCQVALSTRPRSHLLAATLTPLSGASLSWAVAIWLGLQPLPDVSLPLFERAVGIVASSLGFGASGAMWASTTRLGSRLPSSVAG
jgi:hypothetical protein